MRSIRRYVATELQRPRLLLIKILLIALFVFFVVLWHEHQALSKAANSDPSSPSRSSPTRPATRLTRKGPPDVSIIILAQSKHLVHTRNCLRAVSEHVSMNAAFTEVATYEIMVMEVGYEYHRRNGLRRALSLCPECSLVLTNDSMLPPRPLPPSHSNPPLSPFVFCFIIIFIHFSITAKNENHQPLVAAINSGAAAARGAYLFLLTDSTELTSSSLPALLLEFLPPPSLSSAPHIGIVGGRLLAPDQTIVHGGVDFIMTRKSKYGYVDVRGEREDERKERGREGRSGEEKKRGAR